MSKVLKKEFIGLVITSKTLQGLIADAVGKDITAPKRWAQKGNQEKLTNANVLNAIARFANKNVNELTEETA